MTLGGTAVHFSGQYPHLPVYCLVHDELFCGYTIPISMDQLACSPAPKKVEPTSLTFTLSPRCQECVDQVQWSLGGSGNCRPCSWRCHPANSQPELFNKAPPLCCREKKHPPNSIMVFFLGHRKNYGGNIYNIKRKNTNCKQTKKVKRIKIMKLFMGNLGEFKIHPLENP